MASIKGFQMKNVKQTLGREGYGCIATLYLNGKKIGTYEDYGDGGMEDVNFVSKEAEKAMTRLIIDYAKTYKNDFVINIYKERPQQYYEECAIFKKYHPYIPDEDITIQTMASNSIVYIVEDFLKLLDVEKQFKKYLKKGYKAVSVDGDKIFAYPASWSDEKIKTQTKGHELYMSIEDFNK
jgi:hypothetical protein